MRTVGLGIQDFEKLRKNNQFYVDKTGFISKWYYGNDDITLITRPRRFGKTITIDMMNCFFSTSYSGNGALFDDLTVSRDQVLMSVRGTVPVIRISFASVRPASFSEFLMGMAGNIAELTGRFRYLCADGLMTSGDQDLFEKMCAKNQAPPDPETERNKYLEYLDRIKNSVKWLSGWLSDYHRRKIFIFLDEYDTPIQSAYLNHFYDEAMAIMRDFFSSSFKNNPALDRALITGITRIAKESLFSEMNNVACYSVLEGGYETDFGFTRQEMEKILDEFELTDQGSLVKEWYDGFNIGKETDIYNPWSVTNYLAKRPAKPGAYWAQSGGLGLVDHLVRRGGVRLHDHFQKLLQGEPLTVGISEDLIFSDLENDEAAIWSLLVAAGYLKPVSSDEDKNSSASENQVGRYVVDNGLRTKVTLDFTNLEMKVSLLDMVSRWFVRDSINYSEEFAEALLRNDLEAMNREMGQIVLICASSFDSGRKPSHGAVHPENSFHGLATGLLACLTGRYSLTSNRESGLGRYDLSLEPISKEFGEEAYLLEFKVFDEDEGDKTISDTAVRARQQIDQKQYDAGLIAKGFRKDQIHAYGLGFRGKEVVIVR